MKTREGRLCAVPQKILISPLSCAAAPAREAFAAPFAVRLRAAGRPRGVRLQPLPRSPALRRTQKESAATAPKGHDGAQNHRMLLQAPPFQAGVGAAAAGGRVNPARPNVQPRRPEVRCSGARPGGRNRWKGRTFRRRPSRYPSKNCSNWRGSGPFF